MKITRNGIDYELTDAELTEAYEEKEHIYDKTSCMYAIQSGAYLSANQYHKLKELEIENFYDDAAYALRSNLEFMDYDNALNCAIETTLNKYGLGKKYGTNN